MSASGYERVDGVSLGGALTRTAATPSRFPLPEPEPGPPPRLTRFETDRRCSECRWAETCATDRTCWHAETIEHSNGLRRPRAQRIERPSDVEPVGLIDPDEYVRRGGYLHGGETERRGNA